MKTLTTILDMQAWSRRIRKGGETLGFVPTMGALHAGHLSLIRKAKAKTDKVVVSIFVNPTQFDNQDDLEKYPRTLESDLKACEDEGVDAVFLPTPKIMYPDGLTIELKAPALAGRLCGASRPGHFDGVVTIVKKLFEAVEPTHAVFGEKDYQQLAIMRWLVKDQQLPIEIIPHPIVREADGLAMSSRNQRLSADDRRHALALARSIKAVHALFDGGERDVSKLLGLARDILNAEDGVQIDYAEIVDATTLEPISTITQPALYAVAAFVGPVRLIDNCVLRP